MTARRLLLLAIAACVFSLDVSAADAAGIWRGELKMVGGQGEVRRDVTLTLSVNGSQLTGHQNLQFSLPDGHIFDVRHHFPAFSISSARGKRMLFSRWTCRWRLLSNSASP